MDYAYEKDEEYPVARLAFRRGSVNDKVNSKDESAQGTPRRGSDLGTTFRRKKSCRSREWDLAARKNSTEITAVFGRVMSLALAFGCIGGVSRFSTPVLRTYFGDKRGSEDH